MFRKTLTILSLIGLLLSVGLWVASYVSVAVYRVALPWHLCAWADRGSLDISNSKLSQNTILKAGVFNGFFWEYGASVRTTTIAWRWRPQYQADSSRWSIYVPLYLPVLFFGAWLVFLLHPVHRRRKRKKLGLCIKCGYDLRASKERCPECGEAIG